MSLESQQIPKQYEWCGWCDEEQDVITREVIANKVSVMGEVLSYSVFVCDRINDILGANWKINNMRTNMGWEYGNRIREKESEIVARGSFRKHWLYPFGMYEVVFGEVAKVANGMKRLIRKWKGTNVDTYLYGCELGCIQKWLLSFWWYSGWDW